ncbi:hypothetical protein AB0395_34865 [Streptosporangium sp. NPDC051023]|uniref:hypothetical protein n=1 Tax=Streptosporangium sp. NPDC051023 TaxID=3155410 RepID=UPI00344DDDCA
MSILSLPAGDLDTILDAMNLRDGIGEKVEVKQYGVRNGTPYVGITFPLDTFTVLDLTGVRDLAQRFLEAAATGTNADVAERLRKGIVPVAVNDAPVLYLQFLRLT